MEGVNLSREEAVIPEKEREAHKIESSDLSQTHEDMATTTTSSLQISQWDLLSDEEPLTVDIVEIEESPEPPKPTGSFPKALHTCRNIDEQKVKLRTSKDVYDRLKWDAESIQIKSLENQSLDLSSVYIGYKDRFLGMCEVPLEGFTPGGDIPFHRLYYFRTGGPAIDPFLGDEGEVKVREDNLPPESVFLWDRDSRTDLIFNSGNSSAS